MIYTDAYQLADRHTTKMLEILNVIGKRGLRVDLQRFQEFKDFMGRELDNIQISIDGNERLQPLRGYHPSQGYKRVPKDVTGLEQVIFKSMDSEEQHTRWAKRKPFNPGSDVQVKVYMRAQGHAVPKTRKGDETTAGNTLLLHWRKYKDDNYKTFVDYRKVAKLFSTYGAWLLTVRDGVSFATTKFTLRPDTNRLSSTNPNIQNIPKKGEYARLFRRILVASPGSVLLRGDLASAEALIFAWLCGDPLMLRLARLGMHNFAMAKKLGIMVDLNESDDTLRQRFAALKEQHKELYNIIKVCVYGSLYLAGARTLFEKNPKDFGSQREAKDFQRTVFDAIPQIKVFQESICKKRFTYGAQGRNWGWSGNRLYNPFGYSKEFWDVNGGDGPAVCAFLPQSIIACIMKEAMLDLWEVPMARECMRWQIHDELVFDVPKQHSPLLKHLVQRVMGQVWPQLGGLSIGVEIKESEDFS